MDLAGKRILLTGGGGFIGSHLALRLVDDCEIVILDNGHRDALRFTPLREHGHVTFLRGDVLDEEAVRRAMRGCHAVVHLAAIAGVTTVMTRPVETMVVNILGTLHALRAAAEEGVQRFVDFSTSEVFGRHADGVEEDAETVLGRVGEPRWTYAVSKCAAEHLVHSFHRERGLATVSVRPFNVYGPRQVGVGAIHIFVVNALAGRDLVVHGEGQQVRAWCYVDDMVEGALRCLTRDEAVGQVFNIGNPEAAVTVTELAALVNRLCGGRSRIVKKPIDYLDVELRIPSVRKARDILGFEPRVPLEAGLERTIRWYREAGLREVPGDAD